MKNEATMDARREGWLTNDWIVTCDDGREVLLDLRAFREGAEMSLGGELYSLERDGVLRGGFFLRRGGDVVARAVKPSAFRSRFEVEHAGEHYSVERTGFLRSRFVVRQGPVDVGCLARRGWAAHSCDIDLPQEWPEALRIFVFWLALVLWKREDTVAASSAS